VAEEYPFDAIMKDSLAPVQHQPPPDHEVQVPWTYAGNQENAVYPPASPPLQPPSDDSSPLVLGPLDHDGAVVSPPAREPPIGETDADSEDKESSHNPGGQAAEVEEEGDNCVAEFIAFRNVMGAVLRRGSSGGISVDSSGKRSRNTIIGSAGDPDEEDGESSRSIPVRPNRLRRLTPVFF
jgi:hypothetical protein